jgi:hypothetical protein
MPTFPEGRAVSIPSGPPRARWEYLRGVDSARHHSPMRTSTNYHWRVKLRLESKMPSPIYLL